MCMLAIHSGLALARDGHDALIPEGMVLREGLAEFPKWVDKRSQQ